MKKITYLSLLLALIVSMLSGCGEDRTYEYLELTEENQWTYSKMQEVYLWRDKIKEPSRTTFFSKPSKFFSTILYSGDKSSFFTDTISAGSYGLTFAVMRNPIDGLPSKVYALVLMVDPGSPADIAGIKRGMWISSVGGAALTINRYSSLESGGNTTLATEYIDYDDDSQKYYWVTGETLQMSASASYNEPAIYLDSIYTMRSKNIGYLVLNNFDGDNFVEKTQQILLRFAESNVDNVVLDLRYCSGGSIANAAALASSFVAPELYDSTFCKLVNIDNEADTIYRYTEQLTTLCEKKLYIITGIKTAGAAEIFTAAINKARTMYDVMTFGEKSSGVNTITRRYDSPYGFAINPVTNFVALADGELFSAITPDYPMNEQQQIANVHPLGSEQEYILYNVLSYSVNGTLPTGESNTIAVARH